MSQPLDTSASPGRVPESEDRHLDEVLESVGGYHDKATWRLDAAAPGVTPAAPEAHTTYGRHRLQDLALLRDAATVEAILDNVKEAILTLDGQGRVLGCNLAALRVFGYTPEEMERLGIEALFPCEAPPQACLERFSRRDDDTMFDLAGDEVEARRRDGRQFKAELAVSRLALQGRALFVLCLRDITERKQAERALLEEQERLLVTLRLIGDAVITTDASGHINELNPAAEDLIGWEARAARGRPVEEVLTIVDAERRAVLENPVSRCLREGRKVSLPEGAVLVERNGMDLHVRDSSVPIRDRQGHVVGAVMVFHDVSQEQRLQRALNYQVSHDPLTGLINRAEFENRLSHALEEVRRHPERSHALLYLDLDQFKVVNDTVGHAAGDQLLRQLGEALLARIRASDTLARTGGDEFALLLEDCPGREALQIADDLREVVREHRFTWKDRSMSVSASIGVVALNAASPSAEELFSLADVSCYAAKDEGRNRIHLCEAGDVPEKHKEMQWVSRITHAVEHDRLELYFQPIIPIGDNPDRSGHYELLLRMRDEAGKLVRPSEFIPVAERYNLMPALDRWVVGEAMERLLCRDPVDSYTLSVNLSGTSLSDARFLADIIAVFERCQPPPGVICFEITETAAISNLSAVAHFMQALKRLGARFSLDDFGSGLSSFTYLKTLPVDFLKIDGQFIKNITSDGIDQSIVDAINKVGLTMGIQTIAEGVESGAVLVRLAEIGIAYAQGYHIAMPRPVAELPAREARRLSA